MTPMTLLRNGDSLRHKELQAKALRRRRCVIPTNDTSMTLMTLAGFLRSRLRSRSSEAVTAGGRGGGVFAKRNVYRHLLGAPEDRELTF